MAAKGKENERGSATRQLQSFIPLIKTLNAKIGSERSDVVQMEHKINQVKNLLDSLMQNQTCAIS